MESIITGKSTGQEPLWVRVLYKYGIPGFIALYSVYFLTHDVNGKLDAMGKTMESHAATAIVEQKQQKEDVKDQKESATRQEVYLRLLCLNTSKTDEAKARCLTVR